MMTCNRNEVRQIMFLSQKAAREVASRSESVASVNLETVNLLG